MKIILRPDQDYLETTEANLSLLEGFFKSAGLNNNANWRQFQHCFLEKGRSHIEVFGMPALIPQKLIKEREWRFGVYESSPGVRVLSVNKQALAARLLSTATYSQITSVPRDILCLVWDGYAYEDAPPLGAFNHLTALSLNNCSHLKNLSPLSELPRLTALELFGCQVLKDLIPLTRLTELKKLSLVYSKRITNLEPLSILQKLTYLNLRLNTTLEDLSPLSSLTRLQFLELGGCNAVVNLNPVRKLKNLTTLELSPPFLWLSEKKHRGISHVRILSSGFNTIGLIDETA